MKKSKLYMVLIIVAIVLFTRSYPAFTVEEYNALDIDIKDKEDLIYHYHRLAKKLTRTNRNKYKQYAIGYLSKSEFPDLLVFIEENKKEDIEYSTLNLYSYDGNQIKFRDSVSMGLDDSNHNMVIGRISPRQKGVFITNKLRKNLSINYGFLVKNGKLKNILDPTQNILISNYNDVEIKDIDDDGILEYCISIHDPESLDTSNPNRINLWYKWDGVLGSNLIKYDRNINMGFSEPIILNQMKANIQSHPNLFINFLFENKKSLSRFDLSDLIHEYLKMVDDKAYIYILDLFEDSLTNEMMDYLLILNEYYNHTFVFNDALAITEDDLMDRIIEVRNFISTYPYSNKIDELRPILEEYLNVYFINEMDSNDMFHEKLNITV